MKADHFVDVYQNRARAYERMIAAEDVEQNLLPALQSITEFEGRRVLDVGSGTGRLPRLLSGQAAMLVAVDLFQDMLLESRRQRQRLGGRWHLLLADMQALPLASHWADVVTAGWAVGHFCTWYGAAWKGRVDVVLSEMARMARPGGTLIVLETLGTGRTTPAPPSDELARYYRHLEESWSFERQEVSTDYQFDTVEDAVAYTEFFFGPKLAETIRAHRWTRLPEWTGLWSKHLE